MQKRGDGDDVGLGDRRECRHPLLWPSGANDAANLVATHVLGDDRRSREVRPRLATGGIASMTEPALRRKPRASRVDLRGRRLCRRRRLRRPLAGGLGTENRGSNPQRE
jgi:hypothetical protein